MWHLYWRAEQPRRSRTPEPGDTRIVRPHGASTRWEFQQVWHDTPAGTLAGDVPESVRVRGR